MANLARLTYYMRLVPPRSQSHSLNLTDVIRVGLVDLGLPSPIPRDRVEQGLLVQRLGQVCGGASSSERLVGRGIVVALKKDGETRKAEVKIRRL